MLNDDGVQGLIAIVGAPIMLTIKNARLEEESGKIFDERALKNSKFETIKYTLREIATGLLAFSASAVVLLVILYGVGLWVDR